MVAGPEHDVLVIGAGIVGLATARAIQERDGSLRVLVVDKEYEIATHQSAHNSGVIHSGIYYKPRSKKALLCRKGRVEMLRFLRDHNIPFRECGKLILATRESDILPLENLYTRGIQNGLQGLAQLTPKEIQAIEPEARGLAGVHVPETSIVDYREVTQALVFDLTKAGATVRTSCRVVSGRYSGAEWTVKTVRGPIRARYVVNCAGLESDRVARSLGTNPPGKIVPFRGNYFEISGAVSDRIRGLIYPVPDPNLPFLGVHVTPTMNRGLLAGPNALLAFSREGYRMFDIRANDVWETLSFSGFPRFVAGSSKNAFDELSRSVSPRRLASELQSMVPAIRPRDLAPSFAGVRAQFMDPKGKMVDDFVLDHQEGVSHVLNAPSPAATASLAIGHDIAEAAVSRMR